MKKIFLICIATSFLLSCKSAPPSQAIIGDWQRIIDHKHPSNQGYKEITSFSYANIITIIETVDDHQIKHTGTFTAIEDELQVNINEKDYEGTYSISNGELTIIGNEKVYKYKRVGK